MADLIDALNNIIKNPSNKLEKIEKSRTKANIMGDTLDEYIKNCFAGTFNLNDPEKKNLIWSNSYSWLGSQNNPPDLILKGGEAIEIKKIQGIGSIALNSSYPKSTLESSSKMITNGCRNCEGPNTPWKKDLIYSIGTVEKTNHIKFLFFIYGKLYAADEEIYSRIKTTIKSGIENFSELKISETNEIGKVKKIDPLGITDLRIRGMWSIEHPFKVYNYIREINAIEDIKNKYTIYALIPDYIYKKYDNKKLKNLADSNLVNIYEKSIKDPNNPAKLITSKLIKVTIK